MLYKCILLFFIYSFLGWIIEIITCLVQNKKIVNRGFFIGPYCPIYGCGSLAITFLLKGYKDDIIVLFVMAIVICSILEYFTSFIMEKLFHARWWDYSNKKFNVNGRICLDTMIPFGLLGCFITYVTNPFLGRVISLIPILITKIVSILFMIFFLIDVIISFKVMNTIKEINFTIKKDSTEEITKKVKEILNKKDILTKRLVEAFPTFSVFKKFTIKGLKDAKNDIKKTKKQITKLQNEVNKKEKKLRKVSEKYE